MPTNLPSNRKAVTAVGWRMVSNAEIAVNLKGKGDRRQQIPAARGLLCWVAATLVRQRWRFAPSATRHPLQKPQQHHQQTVLNGLFIQRMILIDLTKQVFQNAHPSTTPTARKKQRAFSLFLQ
ncbi:MAG: hypothetical protein ACLUHE_05415 [Christensenellales bacterium]